jgi:hypothetical protein
MEKYENKSKKKYGTHRTQLDFLISLEPRA